jgi:hypothetical protein
VAAQVTRSSTKRNLPLLRLNQLEKVTASTLGQDCAEFAVFGHVGLGEEGQAVCPQPFDLIGAQSETPANARALGGIPHGQEQEGREQNATIHLDSGEVPDLSHKCVRKSGMLNIIDVFAGQVSHDG